MENHSPDEYEFDPQQNSTITSLAGAMKFVAIIEILLGALYAVLALMAFFAGALGNLLVYSVISVSQIVLAWMLHRAADHFRAVVETRGNDVAHLMGALDQLRQHFVTKKIIYLIAIALFVIGFALVFVLAARANPHPYQ